ncbi:MAG: hypothetical protein ACO1QR_15720 [Chthoniobacteraceae bacterium]
MNEKTTPRKYAALSVGAVIGYITYSGVISVARLASEPWYRSPLFFLGGSLFAIAALLTGAVAFVSGASSLDSRHRQFAAIGIIAGLSYLGHITFMWFAG